MKQLSTTVLNETLPCDQSINNLMFVQFDDHSSFQFFLTLVFSETATDQGALRIWQLGLSTPGSTFLPTICSRTLISYQCKHYWKNGWELKITVWGQLKRSSKGPKMVFWSSKSNIVTKIAIIHFTGTVQEMESWLLTLITKKWSYWTTPLSWFST